MAAATVLTNIEMLARDRELHGYAVLDELQRILRQALEHPDAPPRVVISSDESTGEQSSLSPIARLPAAIAFLLENGFVKTLNEEGDEELHEAAVDGDQSARERRRRELIAAISLVQWAADCNTALLTLRVSGLKLLEPLDTAAEHRIEVTVEWEDELGKKKKLKEMSKLFHPTLSAMSPSRRGNSCAPTPTVSPAQRSQLGEEAEDDAVPTARQATSAFAEGEEMANTPSRPAPPGPPRNTNHYHYELSELFSTQCDRRCEMTIALLRRRAVLTDKLLCFACFEYSNFAALAKEVELRDPDHPERLPIGRLHVAVDSMTHRCFALETAARIEKCTPLRLSQYVSPKSSPQQTSLTPPRSPRAVELLLSGARSSDGKGVPLGAAWVGPSVLKSPPAAGVRYDADDYF